MGSNDPEYQREYMQRYWKDHPEKYKQHILKCATKTQYNSDYYKKKSEEAEHLGLCRKCFKDIAKPGSKWCETCRKKYNDWYKQKREEAAKAGLCTKCYTRPAIGKLCERCKEKIRNYSKMYHIKHNSVEGENGKTINVVEGIGDGTESIEVSKESQQQEQPVQRISDSVAPEKQQDDDNKIPLESVEEPLQYGKVG